MTFVFVISDVANFENIVDEKLNINTIEHNLL